MKQLTVLAICLFAAGTIFAQNSAAIQKSTTGKVAAGSAKTKKNNGPAVDGYIRDGHRHPIDDVHAFIYGKDSSIAGSGFTNATGHYETNAVAPGIYSVKYVYTEAKYILVTGVEIKKGLIPLNITMDAPASDTSVAYTVLMPQPEKKPATHSSRKK